MGSVSAILCFSGVVLFLFGLLVGFCVPAFSSPRLGLSAHLTGVQCGTALIAIGLLWPHLRFWGGWSLPTGYALWISLYVLFAGMTLGAVWTTGRSLPVAGGGVPARGWQELTVQTLLAGGAFGTAAAIVAVLIQWHWTAT